MKTAAIIARVKETATTKTAMTIRTAKTSKVETIVKQTSIRMTWEIPNHHLFILIINCFHFFVANFYLPRVNLSNLFLTCYTNSANTIKSAIY